MVSVQIDMINRLVWQAHQRLILLAAFKHQQVSYVGSCTRKAAAGQRHSQTHIPRPSCHVKQQAEVLSAGPQACHVLHAIPRTAGFKGTCQGARPLHKALHTYYLISHTCSTHDSTPKSKQA